MDTKPVPFYYFILLNPIAEIANNRAYQNWYILIKYSYMAVTSSIPSSTPNLGLVTNPIVSKGNLPPFWIPLKENWGENKAISIVRNHPPICKKFFIFHSQKKMFKTFQQISYLPFTKKGEVVFHLELTWKSLKD
jgi:hypothetical protein